MTYGGRKNHMKDLGGAIESLYMIHGGCRGNMKDLGVPMSDLCKTHGGLIVIKFETNPDSQRMIHKEIVEELSG